MPVEFLSIDYFLRCPIDDLAFPWGLRYDGESIWAITCNKWLELGFSKSFFMSVFSGIGMSIDELPDESGFLGSSWIARLA